MNKSVHSDLQLYRDTLSSTNLNTHHEPTVSMQTVCDTQVCEHPTFSIRALGNRFNFLS